MMWNLSRCVLVACALAQAGEKLRAIEVSNYVLSAIEEVEGKKVKTGPLSEITQALAEAGEFDKALIVAEAIDSLPWKVQMLSKVAEALAKSGKNDRASEVANSALVKLHAIADGTTKVAVLGWVSRAFVQSGQFNRGLELAKMNAYERDKVYALLGIVQSLDLKSQNELILSAWKAALDRAQYAGRYEVFTVLYEGAPIIEAMDHGQTL